MKWTYIIPICCFLVVGLILAITQIKIPEPEPLPLLSVLELLDLKENYTDKQVNVSGFLEYKEVVRWTIFLPHIYYTYDSDGDPEMHIEVEGHVF